MSEGFPPSTMTLKRLGSVQPRYGFRVSGLGFKSLGLRGLGFKGLRV